MLVDLCSLALEVEDEPGITLVQVDAVLAAIALRCPQPHEFDEIRLEVTSMYPESRDVGERWELCEGTAA